MTRVYDAAAARMILAADGLDADAIVREADSKFVSAFIRARKPARA